MEKEVKILTAQIEVSVLKLGNRQVTLSVFNQIEINAEHIFNCFDNINIDNSIVYGYVNYLEKDFEPLHEVKDGLLQYRDDVSRILSEKPHRYVIYSFNKKIFKAYLPSGVIYSLNLPQLFIAV